MHCLILCPQKLYYTVFYLLGLLPLNSSNFLSSVILRQELCKPQAQIALLAGSYWFLKTGVTKEILEDSKIELLQFVGLLFLFMLLQYCQLIAPSKSFNTQGNSLWSHKSSFISIWAMSPTE